LEKEKTRNEKIIFIPFLLVLLFIISCSNYKYKVIPKGKESYDYIKIKVNYKDRTNKYNGKILIIKKGLDKKLFLLDPIGRIQFKLILNDEITTAIFVKKKRYWYGKFIYFIGKIWGMRVRFDKFYKLLSTGEIPIEIKYGYSVEIIKDKNNEPKTIIIKKKDIILKIKILKKAVKSGVIDFKMDLKKFKKANLNELFKK